MTTEPKRSVGRPSKYDPEMCETVIELGEQGKSRAQIAAKLRISRQTLENWCDSHPEFLDAIKWARDLALAWWEDQGQAGLTADKFNATAYVFQMCNRFPDDYRREPDNFGKSKDEAEITITGGLPDDKPV